MNPTKHMFSYINQSVRNNWNEPAFSDYNNPERYTYGEAAREMARLGVLFDLMGVAPGAKIAICGTNSSRWAIGFMSVLTNDRVVVSMLPDFTGEDIEKLVNHSDAQLLFASQSIIKKIHFLHMPALKAIIRIEDFQVLYALDEAAQLSTAQWDSAFEKTYPNGYSPTDVHYREDNIDELALINYTSGTTSSPKGVMLSYRALSSNVQYSIENMECHPGLTLVSMLPLAHMFGMLIELVYQFSGGAHICFITRLTTPILMQALKENKPLLMVAVPLVLEKIYQKKLKPIVTHPFVRFCWNKPILGSLIKKQINRGLMEAFGGNLKSLIAGGAAMNPEVEKCLMDIHFPFLVGYGMTECAPLVSYVPWQDFKARSCGKIVDRMEIKIDSESPASIAGEILLRGDNCMMGYYKNEEATQAAFTADGWMHTGDMGVIDAEGNIYLRGRCKTMILSANGQNIYPEEIEAVINSEELVGESLVVNRDGKLIALIYPDPEALKDFALPVGDTAPKSVSPTQRDTIEAPDPHIEEIIRQKTAEAIERINRKLPKYSQIVSFELMQEEFEKTPKRSIKRFLYH